MVIGVGRAFESRVKPPLNLAKEPPPLKIATDRIIRRKPGLLDLHSSSVVVNVFSWRAGPQETHHDDLPHCGYVRCVT